MTDSGSTLNYFVLIILLFIVSFILLAYELNILVSFSTCSLPSLTCRPSKETGQARDRIKFRTTKK